MTDLVKRLWDKIRLLWVGADERLINDELRDRILELTGRVAELEVQLHVEHLRLAACGVVARANTPETALQARTMRDEYRSASCDDVAAAVDREIALRARVAELEKDTE